MLSAPRANVPLLPSKYFKQAYNWPSCTWQGILSGGTSYTLPRDEVSADCEAPYIHTRPADSHACFSNSVFIHNDALHLQDSEIRLPEAGAKHLEQCF